jgi:hypothetical protein
MRAGSGGGGGSGKPVLRISRIQGESRREGEGSGKVAEWSSGEVEEGEGNGEWAIGTGEKEERESGASAPKKSAGSGWSERASGCGGVACMARFTIAEDVTERWSGGAYVMVAGMQGQMGVCAELSAQGRSFCAQGASEQYLWPQQRLEPESTRLS